MENGTGIGIGNGMWEGRFYCYCGGQMIVDGPPHLVHEAKRIFWREHDGPGHGLCDAATCRAARVKKEQLELQI